MFDINAFSPLADLASFVWTLLFPLRALYHFFVETRLTELFFLACILRYTGRRVGGDDPAHRPQWPRRIGLLVFLTISLAGYLTMQGWANRADRCCILAIQATLAMIISEGACATFGPLVAHIFATLVGRNRSLRSTLDRERRAYEAACRALRAAGLGNDELESALAFARQRYLRRIHGEMNDE